jgi:hypothetical protein
MNFGTRSRALVRGVAIVRPGVEIDARAGACSLNFVGAAIHGAAPHAVRDCTDR